MLKRLFSVTLAGVLLWCGLPAVRAEGAVPKVSAASAVLMDAGTGRVLYEKDSHTRRLIASTTKLMTALVALESGHGLEETVTVVPEWTRVEGSSIYLRPGEEITLKSLLYGLLLRSGNDAALAIAGHCGGTVEEFVSQMNRKARELGMEDSSFANPNGLNDEQHYSTAYDMALLGRACLKNGALAEIMSTKTITVGTRSYSNHNKLLWQYEGCVGMKTGYTEKAGRTLVSAAQRDGLMLICVTLNDPNDWADHAALFDYGFANYKAQALTRAGEKAGQLPVSGGLMPVCFIEAADDLTVALSTGETVETACALTETALDAPVLEGTQVGEMVYYVNSEELARVPLVTGQRVPDVSAPKRGVWPWRNVFKN